MKGEKVLIDTSVWIDYFKSTNKNIAEQVDEIFAKSLPLIGILKTLKSF